VVNITGLMDQDLKIGIINIQIEFTRNLKLLVDQLMLILIIKGNKLKMIKKLMVLREMLKKQKIQFLLLNLQTQPHLSQRRLNQSKRKLKKLRPQPLRLQRLTINLLKHQKPPKQRLLQLPPQLPQKKKILQQRKLQLLKKRFKLKPMSKKVKVNLNQTQIAILIPTVIEHYMSLTFIIFKKFSHCKM